MKTQPVDPALVERFGPLDWVRLGEGTNFYAADRKDHYLVIIDGWIQNDDGEYPEGTDTCVVEKFTSRSERDDFFFDRGIVSPTPDALSFVFDIPMVGSTSLHLEKMSLIYSSHGLGPTVHSQIEPQPHDWRALWRTLRDAGATEWGKHEGAYLDGPGAWALELRWDDMVVEASDDAELPLPGTFEADFSAVNDRLRQLASGLTVVSDDFYQRFDDDG